jgi:hypothetical protein
MQQVRERSLLLQGMPERRLEDAQGVVQSEQGSSGGGHERYQRLLIGAALLLPKTEEQRQLRQRQLNLNQSLVTNGKLL